MPLTKNMKVLLIAVVLIVAVTVPLVIILLPRDTGWKITIYGDPIGTSVKVSYEDIANDSKIDQFVGTLWTYVNDYGTVKTKKHNDA